MKNFKIKDLILLQMNKKIMILQYKKITNNMLILKKMLLRIMLQKESFLLVEFKIMNIQLMNSMFGLNLKQNQIVYILFV